MASGWGLNGGPGRCFPFWQELLACYIVNTSGEDKSGTTKCIPHMEDYYECLHHKKEITRARAMQEAYHKAINKNPDKYAPNATQNVRQLGLIPDQKPEDVNIKPIPLLPHLRPTVT